MINLENVSFKYKNSDYILKNISFLNALAKKKLKDFDDVKLNIMLNLILSNNLSSPISSGLISSSGEISPLITWYNPL